MTENIQTEIRLKGLPISAGTVLAPVCLLSNTHHTALPHFTLDADDIVYEEKRLRDALVRVRSSLDDLVDDVRIRVGESEAGIFHAVRLFLDDTELEETLVRTIRNKHCNAEAAVLEVFDAYEARLRKVDNTYIRERVADIKELKHHILETLGNIHRMFTCEGMSSCRHGDGRIVVAHEIMPQMTIKLSTRNVRGIVTVHGGETSHAAILARALGIPMVSGIKDIDAIVSCRSELLVDGDKGEIVIWPEKETVNAYTHAHADDETLKKEVHPPVPALRVMANINVSADVALAVQEQAEGIGLYRTEFEMIAKGDFLSEEEQYDCYSAVVKAMNGAPIYARLFDIGADKSIPFMRHAEEDNPYLGCRGARFLLAHQSVLTTQARALARASRHGHIGIMYPMIVDTNQFLRLREMVQDAIADIADADVSHGIMFEVPSACLMAHELFTQADFGSIGSNDLIQYLFAVDRNNDAVAYDYTPNRDVFWQLIRGLASAAQKAQRPLSLCGELASDSAHIPALLSAGIECVSTSAHHISTIRAAAAAHAAHTNT